MPYGYVKVTLLFDNKIPSEIIASPIVKEVASLLSVAEELIIIGVASGTGNRRLLALSTLVNIQVEAETSQFAALLTGELTQIISNGQLARAMQAIGLPAPRVTELPSVKTSATPPADGPGALTVGSLAGIVVGGVAGGLLIVGGIVLYWRMASKKCVQEVQNASVQEGQNVPAVSVFSQLVIENSPDVHTEPPQFVHASCKL
jgi:hypothetical protein